MKFGALLERGEYRYDALDHHGPTLYYFALPFAWAHGQTTKESLTESALRLELVLAGRQLDRAAPVRLAHRIDRVDQQIDQHLRQLRLVAEHPR